MDQKQTNFPVVVVRGLVKTFRDFWGRARVKAVDGIDFEIHHGEVFALLGPNGSGKSTTVKMILGLLYPTFGDISVFGKSPRAVETKKEIGYLPEETYLYPYLTARETLDFYGSLFHLSAAERKSRIDQLLDMVGLSHARDRRVGEFSKGMARRIGIAQAMINDPDFLILDEPTSGLDPIGCREVKDLILTLKKRGKTILVTSHLLSDVEEVCDHVVILYGGKIRAQGKLDDLLTMGEQTRVTFSAPDAAAQKKFESALQAQFPAQSLVVDHPRRSLEQYFLDVVLQAKNENVSTSGAAAGGKIADYLSAPDSRDAVLQSLMVEEKAAPVQSEKAVEVVADPAKEEAKLRALTSENAVPEKVEPPVAAAESEKEKMAKAEEKLDRLFGGK